MLLLDKPSGITPIDFWKNYRDKQCPGVKGSVCGKLDPMASGKLLVLIGDECQKYHKSHQLWSKIYEVTVTVGITTDTDDILGIPVNKAYCDNLWQEKISNAFTNYQTIEKQKFHPYSAICVLGALGRKPLWKWSQLGLIDTITIPEKPVQIFSLQIVDWFHISYSEYLSQCISRLQTAQIDPDCFRLPQIVDGWKNLQSHDISLPQFTLKTEVSSGVYIRQMIRDIQSETNIPMHCTRIHRVQFTRSSEFLDTC